MKAKLLLITLIYSFSAFSMSQRVRAQKDETMKAILVLDSKVGDKVKRRLEILSNQISPNQMSVNDQYELRIDGKQIPLKRDYLSQIARMRRQFSYDHFTGGILKPVKQAICMLGGPPTGEILSTLYLTYNKSSVIVKSELKPVYSEGSCHFTELYTPKKQESTNAAIKLFATLRTIMEYEQNREAIQPKK